MPSHAGAQAVARAIKEKILRRDLLPGEKLVQERLAAELGVSRVPLREAMLILASQGVLTHQNNAGFVVTKRTPWEAVQLVRMRTALELELLNDIRWPGKDELADLAHTNRVLARRGTHNLDVLELVDANHHFHRVVWSLSSATLIEDEVARMWETSDIYAAVDLADPTIRERSVAEHQRIIDALTAQDAGALRRAVKSHQKSTFKVARRQFSTTPPGESHTKW